MKKPTPLLVKLGAIAVHAEEFFSPTGHQFDRNAIEGLLADHEVQQFLHDPDMRVFLPLKRPRP